MEQDTRASRKAKGSKEETLGDYRWSDVDKIGAGQYGTIHKGWTKDNFAAPDLAVKILRKNDFATAEWTKRCVQREIKVLKELRKFQSPYITQLFDAQMTASGDVVLFMELCDGDLQQLVDSQRHGFDKRETKQLIAQLAEALKVLNDTNIIHRDIKPGNTLYRCDPKSNGRLYKLADFGLAKSRMTQFEDNEALTQMNSVAVGTVAYMAPEAFAIEEQGPLGNLKADLWSFGCLLYFCLTKKPSFVVPASMYQKVLNALKAKGDAMGMKMTSRFNQLAADPDDMLQAVAEYEEYRELPLSVRDRLSAAFADDATALIKQLLVYESEKRLSFADFYPIAREISANHYVLCDALSGEIEPFVPGKYVKIERLIAYVSKKKVYTAGKFVLFCDHTHWMYPSYCDGQSSILPDEDRLENDAMLCVISEEKNCRKVDPSLNCLEEAYGILSRSFSVPNQSSEIEHAERKLLTLSDSLAHLQKRQLGCLAKFWAFVCEEYLKSSNSGLSADKTSVEVELAETTANIQCGKDCVQRLPKSNPLVRDVLANLSQLEQNTKELKMKFKVFNRDLQEVALLSTYPALTQISQFELHLFDLCSKLLSASKEGNLGMVPLKRELEQHIKDVFECVHAGFSKSLRILQLSANLSRTLGNVKLQTSDLLHDSEAVLQNTCRSVFTIMFAEDDEPSSNALSIGEGETKPLQVLLDIVQHIRDAEESNSEWTLLRGVGDSIESQIQQLLPTKLSSSRRVPSSLPDSRSSVGVLVKLFPNYAPGDVVLFMPRGPEAFTGIHFTDVVVYLSMSSVSMHSFQPIPGSSVFLAKVEDFPQLVSKPSRFIPAKYSVRCSPLVLRK